MYRASNNAECGRTPLSPTYTSSIQLKPTPIQAMKSLSPLDERRKVCCGAYMTSVDSDIHVLYIT